MRQRKRLFTFGGLDEPLNPDRFILHLLTPPSWIRLQFWLLVRLGATEAGRSLQAGRIISHLA